MSFFDKTLYASDYRLAAENKCSKYSSTLAVIYLVYGVIIIAANIIFNTDFFVISTGSGEFEIKTSWGTTLELFFGGHFLVSFICICKKIDNNQKLGVSDLFEGFKNYGNVLGVYILKTIYEALWMLLFFVPGLIKSYSYSMALYILNDNKNMQINDCITESRKMMDGNKWKLFCLDMSYIGWYLLSVFTLGILALWVAPKHHYARYLFYLKVSGKGLSIEENEIKTEEHPQTVIDELDKKFEEIE